MLLHINENIDLGEEGLKKLFFALFCLSRNICNSKLKTGSWRTFLIELIIRNGPILFGDWTVLSWVISSCIIKMTFSFRNRVPNRKANMSTVEHLVIHGANKFWSCVFSWNRTTPIELPPSNSMTIRASFW